MSYEYVGATAGVMPTGYRTIDVERQVGHGRQWFDTASRLLLTWEMHRGAGLVVDTTALEVVINAEAVISIGLGLWSVRAPVRVVDVFCQPSLAGFAYGTLPGHPERGEERFLVHLDADEAVRVQIRAFSRPGRWSTRLAGPLAHRVQNAITQRYFSALIQPRES